MKRIYVLFAFLMLSLGLNAQNTFEELYDFSSYDQGTSVVEVSDGNYIVCGNVLDDTNDDFDVFVTKFDDTGTEIWTELYTSVGVGDDSATYITETSDGYYLICGITTDNVSDDVEGFLLKIDEDGNEIFVETYGDEGDLGDKDGFFYVMEDDDGLYLAVGASEEGTKGDTDGWLVAIDTDGTFLDEDFFGLNGNDVFFVIIPTDDGGYIMGGNSYDDTNEDMDGMLIKLDEFGDEEWTYYSNTTSDEFFNDLIVLDNGDYLIVGAEEDADVGDMDLLVERISADGSQIIYSYTFDYSAGDDYAHVAYTLSDQIVLAGYVEDADNDDFDAYMASVNPTTGDLTGDVLYGDIYDDYFYDFTPTSDGGFICVGVSEDDLFDGDLYIVKTDANGGQTAINTIETTSLRVYPNPAQDYLRIDNDKFKYAQCTITNIAGQVVLQREIESNEIDISTLAAGAYIIKIEAANEIFNAKFVKK